MIRHMTEMTSGPKSLAGGSDHLQRRERINGFHALSRRGLWRILLFLAVSLVALGFRDVDILTAVPENVAAILGAPPPTMLIHLVLVVTTLSSLILVPARASAAPEQGQSWLRFAIITAFYPLYALDGSLGTWFSAVLAAGVLVLLVEHVSVWASVRTAVAEEKERLGKLR